LEDALRTVGAALDAHRVRQAQLTVVPAGIEVHADWMYGYRCYSWADVAGLSRGHAAQRRAQPVPRPWLDPFSLTRWSVFLRLVGRLLDAQEVRACDIEAVMAPPSGANTLRVSAAGQLVLDQAALAAGLSRLRSELATSAPHRAAVSEVAHSAPAPAPG
jgi:hypothetical protein